MGVRRISLGGVLAAAAWGGFSGIAREIAEEGTFAGLAGASPGVDFNALFRG
jgi:2-methylisocitrate lyase-like PEP mutase family enzyme